MDGGDRKEERVQLSALPNIGKVTERWLHDIGIHDEEDLRRMGAVQAYRLIRAKEAAATPNLLYALHGALTGTPWNDLAAPIKEMLRRQAERDERADQRPR